MRIVLKILKLFRNVVLNSIFALVSLFIKRDDNLWVVGGWFGKRFADNSSCFFSFLSKNTSYRAIWITKSAKIVENLRSQGLEVYRSWEMRGIWFSLKAKYHIVDQGPSDINPFTSFGAVKLNLWHGFPLKRIGELIDSPRFNLHKIKERVLKIPLLRYTITMMLSEASWNNMLFLSTSEFASELYEKAFALPKERMIVANYPRNEYLLGKIEVISYNLKQGELINKFLQLKKDGHRIISYFPTFRDTGEDSFFGTQNPHEVLAFLERLSEMRAIVVCKFHYAVNIFGSKAVDAIPQKLDNLIMLDDKMDIYPFMKLSDILITDYSSVFFDFLWLERPIVFYPYDLDSYKTLDRGLIFDYEKMTPGPKAYRIQDLLKILCEAIDDPTSHHKYVEERRRIKDYVFDNPKGCEQIAGDLVNYSKKGVIT